MTNMKKRIAATLTAAILTTVLTVPAMATETPDKSVRVSSYKGSTLEVGDRSGLIIGPSGANYTVTSSNPDTVAVEQVLTFWVAIAKAEGIAEITVSNSAGERGTVILTVGSAAPAAPEAPASGDSAGLTDNLEMRQELIRLINQTRKDNGVPELPVNEALMNAAQACSNQRYTWHHSPEKSKAAVDAGHGRPEMQLHRRGRDPVGLLTKSSKVRLNYDIIKEQGGEGMQLRYHMVTIEDLMPAGHFLRKLEAALDLSFVYEETAQAKAWFSEGIPEAVRGSGASVHGAGPGERAAGGDGFHPCKGKRIPGIGVSGRSAGGARGILGAAGFL